MLNYYKVTNVDIAPICMPWVTTLFDEEQMEAFEAFKLSQDFIGFNPTDKAIKQKVATVIKMRSFIDTFGRDVQIKTVDATPQGSLPRLEWRFVIGPNVKKLIETNDVRNARKVCEQYEIPYTKDDSLDALAEKILVKFGPNVRIVTETQWNDSGMRQAYERKEIISPARPGVSERKVVYEGPLVAEEMTNLEVDEYMQNKRGSAEPEATKPVIASLDESVSDKIQSAPLDMDQLKAEITAQVLASMKAPVEKKKPGRKPATKQDEAK